MKLITTILLFILTITSAYAQTPAIEGTHPFVLGVVDELSSTILGEKRTLNIYLPEGYRQDDTTRYPVIYLLDGGADEDFIHVAGIVQFTNFSWVNRVPKSIVVGIANTDRRRDFTFPTTIKKDKQQYPTTGGSEHFIEFLEQELQPYIAQKYKVNTTRTLIGESLGGLLATEILFRKPGLFDKYIIISPSIWWDNGSVLNLPVDLLQRTDRPTDVYIGVGKEGATPGDHPRVMEVDAHLLYDKIKSAQNRKVHAYFDYLPQETHATIGHPAVFNAFRLLYPAQ